jgi:hypothetical protein
MSQAYYQGAATPDAYLAYFAYEIAIFSIGNHWFTRVLRVLRVLSNILRAYSAYVARIFTRNTRYTRVYRVHFKSSKN